MVRVMLETNLSSEETGANEKRSRVMLRSWCTSTYISERWQRLPNEMNSVRPLHVDIHHKTILRIRIYDGW